MMKIWNKNTGPDFRLIIWNIDIHTCLLDSTFLCPHLYYKNIGYLYNWEFDISHANWKICKICEWDGVFT
jgi:hypothetical protein